MSGTGPKVRVCRGQSGRPLHDPRRRFKLRKAEILKSAYLRADGKYRAWPRDWPRFGRAERKKSTVVAMGTAYVVAWRRGGPAVVPWRVLCLDEVLNHRSIWMKVWGCIVPNPEQELRHGGGQSRAGLMEWHQSPSFDVAMWMFSELREENVSEALHCYRLCDGCRCRTTCNEHSRAFENSMKQSANPPKNSKKS